MAKLLRSFYAPGFDSTLQDAHHTRPPTDVSGSYRAWFYLPRHFRITGSGWRNIMEFKERYWDGSQSGYMSDPAWWLVLYKGRHGKPYAHVNYWNGGNAGTAGRTITFPRGRWVEVRADLYQGERIEWFVDGRRIAVGKNRRYPVGPSHGALSLAWDFGVGNYAGAGKGTWRNRLSRPLYVGAAALLK